MRWLIAAVLAASWLPTIAQAQTEKALILFEEKARHTDLAAKLRLSIEQAGGRVYHVIGLAGVIANIESGSRANLAAVKGVRRVYNRPITPPPSGDAHTGAAVAAWNRIAGTRPAAKRPAGRPPPGAQPMDLLVAPDLPRDPAQLRALESEYRTHWQEAKRNLPPQLQRSASVGCHTNGAGPVDTSLYFAGDIAVGVFYADGSSGGWTEAGSTGLTPTASTTQTFVDIVYSLHQFIDIQLPDSQPNARITFTFVNEVTGAGNPLLSPPNDLIYVNNLRNTWCTDWAFMVTVQNGGMSHAGIASLLGPGFRVDRTASIFDYAVRHETGHVLGALDQYAPFGPAARYGYLMAANANACGNDGSGWFPSGGFPSGAGECLDDLMAGWTPAFGYNSIIGAYTAGQLGWHDSEGDGVLDVTRTKPVIDKGSVVCTPGALGLTCQGVAFDRPLLNQLPPPYGNVSINSVAAVQWRINAAAWQDAAATDGVFDSVSEGFNFTTPPLPNGTYTVQIRAINTVGAVTPIPYEEQITINITGSIINNTQPFGSLTVTPERAMVGTPIKASGVASRDLETAQPQLEYSWDWGDGAGPTGFQVGPFKTKTSGYSLPGTYSVQMQVRDQGGLIHTVSRKVMIVGNDTLPVVALTAVPESQHLTPSANYSLTLSVAGSYDAETPFSALTVDWDVQTDCKGFWPNQFTSAKTKAVTLVNANVPKSDRRCVRARVKDGVGNISPEARRFVWVVPYNHRPSISAVTFALDGAGPDYIATVNATDVDKLTLWDGMLEYRVDYEGDGIWDTKFDPNPSIPLLAAYRYTAVFEVKDRFHSRARWSCSTSNPPSC